MSSRGVLGTVVWCAAAAGVLLAASCEFPFSLRDSEDPSGTSIKIQMTTDPGFVRTNVWRCYINREPTPYGEQITDDFVFVTDPRDAAALEQTYGGDFSEWDGQVDKDLTSYVLDDERCTVVWCIPRTVGDQECLPDSTVLESTETLCSIQYTYNFTFVLYGDWKHIAGEATLSIRKEAKDNLWRIFKWEDIKPQSPQADTLTWGMLKGQALATK